MANIVFDYYNLTKDPIELAKDRVIIQGERYVDAILDKKVKRRTREFIVTT